MGRKREVLQCEESLEKATRKLEESRAEAARDLGDEKDKHAKGLTKQVSLRDVDVHGRYFRTRARC